MAMVPCPRCAKLNRADAKFCSGCGLAFNPSATVPQPRPTFVPTGQTTPPAPTRAAGGMTKTMRSTSYVIVILALLVGVCVVGYILFSVLMQSGLLPNLAVAPASATPVVTTEPPVRATAPAPTATVVPVAISSPTAIIVTATSPATAIAELATDTATPISPVVAAPTATPLPPGALPPLTSLKVSKQNAANSGIRVNVRYADNTPAKDVYVKVSTQKQDVSGNPVVGDSLAGTYTDNAGTTLFNLKPGTYAVETSLRGYDFGNQFNYAVTNGSLIVLDITLARIRVGVKDADGKPLADKYITVAFQKSDVSGNPVRGDRVSGNYTDNTGTVTFDLTAGYYVVDVGNLAGHPYGDPFNRPARAGDTTQIIVGLGRLRVGIKDVDGKAISDKYVSVNFQKPDVDGKPMMGDRVAGAYTDNTGTRNFDLTPGVYAVDIGDLMGAKWGDPLNKTIQAGATNSIVVSLGRISVGLKSTDGKPLTGRGVTLYHQKKDVAGNITKGERISSGYTDNAGLLIWNVTAGNYVLEIENIATQNITVSAGKTLVSDGKTVSVR